jgi:hypothetical protein
VFGCSRRGLGGDVPTTRAGLERQGRASEATQVSNRHCRRRRPHPSATRAIFGSRICGRTTDPALRYKVHPMGARTFPTGRRPERLCLPAKAQEEGQRVSVACATLTSLFHLLMLLLILQLGTTSTKGHPRQRTQATRREVTFLYTIIHEANEESPLIRIQFP